MNLADDDDDTDPLVNQHCLELAHLLRTDQTDRFLRLYDSLPAECSGSRVSRATAEFFLLGIFQIGFF